MADTNELRTLASAIKHALAANNLAAAEHATNALIAALCGEPVSGDPDDGGNDETGADDDTDPADPPAADQ